MEKVTDLILRGVVCFISNQPYHKPHITQSKFHIGMTYKGDHLSFLPKRINVKIIFATMMPMAASLRGQLH